MTTLGNETVVVLAQLWEGPNPPNYTLPKGKFHALSITLLKQV